MDRYSFLKWSKSQMAKIADPAFDNFIFVFTRASSSDPFRLEGMAFDAAGNSLGGSFKPSVVTGKPPRPLPNTLKGTFKLDKATLASFGIDGTFDCFLNPKKSHEGESSQRTYVSYKITDRENALAFRSFSMNPSPPYNSGNTSTP